MTRLPKVYDYDMYVENLTLKVGPFELHQEGKTELRFSFTYSPGRPGTMYRSNGDPGDPPEPAELEVIKIETLNSLVMATQAPGAKLLVETGEDISKLINEDEFIRLEEWLMEKSDLIPDDGPEPDFM